LLVEMKGAKEVTAGLKRYGVYVRDRSQMIPDCLRISITDLADARRLVEALDRYRSDSTLSP